MVKDCKLGGRVPVLAVIIFNKEHNKCLINFGSDPIFEVALMRCITEAFQGFVLQDEQKMYDFDLYAQKVSINYKKCIDDFQICNLFPKLILSNSVPNYKSAFLEEHKSSADTLFFVKKLLAKGDYELYIHDASFLGYPSYHIYIPDLTIQEIEICIDRIESYLEDPFNNFVYTPDYGRFLKDLTGVIIDRNNSDYNFSVEYLLFLLNIKVRRYDKAYYWLDVYLKNLESLNLKLKNTKYYQCVLLCLKLTCEKIDPSTIWTTLKNIFDIKMVQEVLTDVMKQPDEILNNFDLPTCGNCRECKVEKFCFYNRWKEIAQNLQLKINESTIDQYNISKVFNH